MPAPLTSIYRDLLRSTGIYSVAVAAERLAGFLMLPVYTHFLTPADYGILELVNLTATLLGMLLGVRLGQALFVFYFTEPSQKERDAYISTAFLGAVLVALAMVGLAFAISAQVSQLVFGTVRYAIPFRLMLISLAASVPVEVGLSYMRVSNRPMAFVRTSLFRLGFGVTMNLIFLCGFKLGLSAILWSSLILALGTSAYLAWYCLSRVGFIWSWPVLRQLLRYSLPLGISSVSMFAVHFCDRFFLNRQVSLDQVGIYALGYQFGWIIAFVQLPFSNYWNSQALAILQRPGGERIYARVCTYLALGLTSVAVLISVFIEPLLRVMTAPAFWVCWVFVPALAAAYVVRAVGDFLRYILVLERRTSWDAAITAIGGLTALGGYAVLIPRFALWGAVLATVAAFLVMFVLGLLKAQAVHPLPYEFRRLTTIALCAAPPIVLSYCFHPRDFVAQVLLGVGLACIFPLLLLMVGFSTAEERQRASGLVLSFRSRLSAGAFAR